MSETRLHGVDFSGAASGGRAKIRHAFVHDGRARVEALDRTGLRRAILASRDEGTAHLWRIDAPFSLPIVSIERLGLDDVVRDGAPLEHGWVQLARWMHAFGEPRQWRRAMRAVDRREPKRTTDRAARTPLAPANLRVFKQTWTVACEVLLPLVGEGVHVEPIAPADSPVRVCESCPASSFLAFGLSPRGYKGVGDPPMERRAELVEAIAERGVPIDDALAREAIRDREGDVLDALALLLPPTTTVVPREALVEAWVY